MCRGEDGLRGPVALAEAHRADAAAKLGHDARRQVGNVGVAPAVDGLVRVACWPRCMHGREGSREHPVARAGHGATGRTDDGQGLVNVGQLNGDVVLQLARVLKLRAPGSRRIGGRWLGVAR